MEIDTFLAVDRLQGAEVIERVSTELLCTQIHLQPLGRDTLRAAEAVAGLSMS
jgi:hypothetical protein